MGDQEIQGKGVLGNEQKIDVIPSKYAGLPSEVVEELWQVPMSVDVAVSEKALRDREQTLNALKTQERKREDQKEQNLSTSYQGLSAEQKAQFPKAQKQAGARVIEHIQGKGDIDTLSREEQFVLSKLQNAYREFKAQHPNDAFAFELSQDIDKRIYANLVQRLSFYELGPMQTHKDQAEIAKIRSDYGLPKPKQESTKDPDKYLDWSYAKKLNDLARDMYYKLSQGEKNDYKQQGVGDAMALLLYIPFGKRDNWPTHTVEGSAAPSKQDCIDAAMKTESYLQSRGLI